MAFNSLPVTLIKYYDASYRNAFNGGLLMKRNVVSKNNANSISRQYLEVDLKAVTSLRTVGEHEAFYFYVAVGKPTGEVARNLSDFLDKVKTVKSESLVFHLQRRDFQNWVGKTIGDPVLAEKLGKISSSGDVNIRTNICKAVRNHITKLSASSQELSIGNTETGISVRV